MAHQAPVGIHDPVHDSIASEMKARLGEYSQQVQIDVFVGTYNLNGKPPSGESLEAWLCFDKGTISLRFHQFRCLYRSVVADQMYLRYLCRRA